VVTSTSRALTLFLAGDAIMIRPWSNVRDPAFLELIEQIRMADVAITNLETVIHEFKGHAQADSGGVYMASPPQIAAELKWAGFDMLAHANNHAFDYGSLGVLETIEHVEREGLIVAGSGKDLQNARAPRYIQRNGSTIALVAMASDFVRYGKASHSRPDLGGRPGVNPLTVKRRRIRLQPGAAVSRSPRLDGLLRRMRWTRGFLSLQVTVEWGRRAASGDRKANLAAISEAASKADVVIASVHAHRQGPWLTNFAHEAIGRGADIVFIHGPHHVRGMELHRGKPIFYSLGDFVFEAEHVIRFPSEAYERLGLPADAPVEKLRRMRDKLTSGLSRRRRVFEGFVACVSVAGQKIKRIRLFPIDLQFHAKEENRGRPQLASPKLGRRIIKSVASRSKEFGTRIQYDLNNGWGEVILE
jgi:poly-gamma-glutamate synthesis protein (capsule biosynthesis protein)